MSKPRIVAAVLTSLVLMAPLFHASAASAQPTKCPDYPPNTTTDSTYEGSLNVSGLRKLADAEIKGKVQTQVKRFTANNPDANQITVLLALLAYNCRAIQEADLPENKKFEAREKFNRIIIETLSPKNPDEVPRPKQKKSPPSPANQNSFSRIDKIASWRAPAPSLVLVAESLQEATRSFKGALHSTYLAALGGAYIPVVPYDLMLDEFMLSLASKQDFMDGIPNVETIPHDSQTSLAYNMCSGLLNGENAIQRTFTLYNSWVPEYLIQDIQELRGTDLYKYFSSYVKKGECSVFLSKLKNRKDLEEKKIEAERIFSIHAIPREEPKFTAEALKAYINKVKNLDTDSGAILSAATAKRGG